MSDGVQSAGARFAELHREGCFLLANVADPATAAAMTAAGASAIASSSSAHADQIGRADARGAVTLAEHLSHVEMLVAATDLPLNVDAENAYGHEPEDVANAVRAFGRAGAAGMGIEDWSGNPQRGSYDRSLAVARIEAATEAAAELGEPFVITGRTDILIRDRPGDLDEAIARLNAFAKAGASCLFAPGLRDLATISTVVEEVTGPLNVLVALGAGLNLHDLAASGVRRVSIGGSLYRAQAAFAQERIARLLDDGDFSSAT